MQHGATAQLQNLVQHGAPVRSLLPTLRLVEKSLVFGLATPWTLRTMANERQPLGDYDEIFDERLYEIHDPLWAQSRDGREAIRRTRALLWARTQDGGPARHPAEDLQEQAPRTQGGLPADQETEGSGFYLHNAFICRHPRRHRPCHPSKATGRAPAHHPSH